MKKYKRYYVYHNDNYLANFYDKEETEKFIFERIQGLEQKTINDYRVIYGYDVTLQAEIIRSVRIDE